MTGVESNIAEAGFDSVLLRTGQNGVMFSVANSVAVLPALSARRNSRSMM
jgi:hypothetical protein